MIHHLNLDMIERCISLKRNIWSICNRLHNPQSQAAVQALVRVVGVVHQVVVRAVLTLVRQAPAVKIRVRTIPPQDR